VVLLAPVVEIGDAAGRVDRPAEDTYVLVGASDLEHCQQPRLVDAQHQQGSVLVVFAELVELAQEPVVLQKAASRVEADRWKIEAIVGLDELVEREDVVELCAPQTVRDVVAEEKVPADVNDVARHAVVLGAHAHVADDAQLRTAERLLASAVELLGALAEVLGL